MKKYQNISQSLTASTFIEIGTFSGAEVSFAAKRPTTKVGNQQVTFAKGAVALRMPHEVLSCVDECVVGTVMESASFDFNVVTVEALDVLKAEIDRIYALTKASLVHGVLPPVYSDFLVE